MTDWWLRSGVPQEYANERKYAAERKQLCDNLQTHVKSLLLVSFAENTTGESTEITENDEAFVNFANTLEIILQHGLRTKIEKLRIYGVVYYWSFIDQLDRFHSSSAPFMNKIRSLQNVKSAVGKGRAWIRASLSNNMLEQYLSIITRNVDLCRTWYQDHAFLNSKEDINVLLSLLAGLVGVSFKLIIDDSALDIITPVKKKRRRTKKKEKSEKESCIN